MRVATAGHRLFPVANRAEHRGMWNTITIDVGEMWGAGLRQLLCWQLRSPTFRSRQLLDATLSCDVVHVN